MWRRFLASPYAPLLTHVSLATMTALLFALLWHLPFAWVFVPCALLQHRVGVLLHEYIHGIPFRVYRHNLAVLSLWDGLLLLFGFVDLFRGTHLAHHRWLNAPGDPGFQAARETPPTWKGRVQALEGVQHVLYLLQILRGGHPYVIPSRIALGAALSCGMVAVWVALGRGDIAWKLVVLTVFNTAVPISFRGAVEHHSYKGDPMFANEYRVIIPLFNLNRHIHHHIDSRCPWYRLEFKTDEPLWTWHYFTYWFRVYVTRDLALMQPVSARSKGAARVEPDRPVA